jgi:hypothetical protein
MPVSIQSCVTGIEAGLSTGIGEPALKSIYNLLKVHEQDK